MKYYVVILTTSGRRCLTLDGFSDFLQAEYLMLSIKHILESYAILYMIEVIQVFDIEGRDNDAVFY